MDLLMTLLLVLVLLNAIAVVLTKNLLSACLIFMAQSLVMVLLWILLQAPDLAITEAAVGAGVSSLLFFLALKRMGLLEKGKADPAERRTTSDGSSGRKRGNM